MLQCCECEKQIPFGNDRKKSKADEIDLWNPRSQNGTLRQAQGRLWGTRSCGDRKRGGHMRGEKTAILGWVRRLA
jgi:hypothetical protein